jgi:hypothetical protein
MLVGVSVISERWQSVCARVSANYDAFVKAEQACAPKVVEVAQSRLDGSLSPSRPAVVMKQNLSSHSFFGFNEVRKRGRVKHHVITGLKIAHVRGERTRFLTLSTWAGYDKVNLSRDFETFFKRCEHVNFSDDGFNPFHAIFVKVTTDEGNGVIHCIFKAVPVKRSWRQATLFSRVRKRKGSVPVNRKFDVGYLPFEWIKVNWADITGNDDSRTQNVSITQTYGSPKRLGFYFCQLAEYVGGQDSLRRLSYSKDWLYRGCVKDWNNHFRPKLAELFSVRASLDDAVFNDEMRAIYSDWDKWILNKFS